jgi:NADP-dependent 3-hydroxy acid dehydrogenase YdfG
MTSNTRSFAIVTGASSGIGYELAKICAENGFEAMMKGEGDVVSGWKNKLQTTIANVTPSDALAEQHRKMAEPGSAKK